MLLVCAFPIHTELTSIGICSISTLDSINTELNPVGRGFAVNCHFNIVPAVNPFTLNCFVAK
jgi:hypothetical protein